MFSTIYKYEINFWIKQPSIYFYALFFFAIPCVMMWGMGSESNFEVTGEVFNSAKNILDFTTRRFLLLLLFILPGIMGLSIFRDYKSKMYTLLYSFPFSKRDYLLGKFMSAFTVSSVIGVMILLGLVVGFGLAGGVNNHLLAFDFKVYFQAFFVFIIPNIFFFGTLIFAAVTFSRNVYVGYIAIVVLILIRQMISAVVSMLDNLYLSALLEPMGVVAIRYQTALWTVAEQNQNQVPIQGIILHNRLLWLSISIILFIWTYRTFSFRQNAPSFRIKKIKNEPIVKSNFGNITKVNLPNISFDFSLKQQLKSTLKLAWIDFKFIINSWMFISIVIVGSFTVILIIAKANPMFGTKGLPTTSQMLVLPMMFFSGIINLLTFLYAGILIHRAKLAKTNQLVDISPLPNWSFLSSKIIALGLMQVLLLSLLMFGGIFTQLMDGYYQLEIGHYLFELYGLNLIHFVIWSCLAIFIQSLFDNPYLGFFVLILLVISMIFLGEPAKMLGFPLLGEAFLRYNQVPGPPPQWLLYSDMDGYGTLLEIYWTYKIHWFLAAILLIIGTVLIWQRGLTQSLKERWQLAKSRIKPAMIAFAGFVFILFLGTGFKLYQTTDTYQQQLSEKERKELFLSAEKKYERLNHLDQPTIKSVSIDMDIYPESRDFKAKGRYWIINETATIIDTLVLSYLPEVNTEYTFNQDFVTVSKDTIAGFLHLDILKLQHALFPGDSIEMTFSSHNNPNTFMNRSNWVKGNGTFIEDDIFPQFGNWLNFIREKNHWSTTDKAHPADSTSWKTENLNRITFETTLSTSADQIAIAPGDLIREWTENNRHYYHYKTHEEIAHAFLFMSGDYAVKKDKWNDVELEIYYHKGHAYNIDRIMDGKKAALGYCSENFSPYPFNQLRTVEFSQVGGASAHSFPQVIPSGEGTGFVVDIDDNEGGGTDFAFGTSVHETAHQWWGNELQACDVIGNKMVVESMAEYVNVMIKKQEKGEAKMRNYLHANMDIYLEGRTYGSENEQPLMYTYPNQNYIHYPKGAIIFYAFSDYIGEDNLNTALKKYIEQVEAKTIPSTSIAMVALLRQATPDSLAYLIEDMFETITIYDNRVVDVTTTPLPNGQYQIDIEFLVRKYRSINHGQRSFTNMKGDSLSYQLADAGTVTNSYPLQDYIDIGIFGEQDIDGEQQEIPLYMAKHLVTGIHNKISIIVNQKPTSAGVDPYVKLIDTNRKDNVKKLR